MADTATPDTATSPDIRHGKPGGALAPDEVLLHAAPASNYAALDDARFRVVSDFEPAGDQPEAIAALAEGIERGRAVPDAARHHRVGQDVHDRLDDRAGAAAHAGPRAQQVASPPSSPTSSASSSPTTGSSTSSATTTTTSPRPTSRRPTPTSRRTRSINDEIDRLRHSATAALLTRRDVIVVASVSCIYGLGSPEEYREQLLDLQRRRGATTSAAILRRLVDMQYDRNDMNLGRGKFRVRGDTIEVHPAYEETVRAHRVVRRRGRAHHRRSTRSPASSVERARRARASSRPPTTSPATSACSRRSSGIEAELQERLA